MQEGLSKKAQGKRAARNTVTIGTQSTERNKTPVAVSPAPEGEVDAEGLRRIVNRRVQPSRARRGGFSTQIGTSEIDMNILDMLKRAGENEPLIPTRTVFILTTNSKLAQAGSSINIGLNEIANERYFDRPEVIKACKEQQNIQIPCFKELEDNRLVVNRFRSRTGEGEHPDLLDAAFEKRHRRHELVEKRQRLREKEKLQHEHYKLKERIEQLRSMDYNAFLSLPSNYFDHLEASNDMDYPDVPDLGPSTSATLHEGERRRRLMLGVASSLEERYRTLLPPSEKKPAQGHRTGSVSAEPSILDEENHHLEESAQSNHRASSSGKARLTTPKIPDKLHAEPLQATPMGVDNGNANIEMTQSPPESGLSTRTRKSRMRQIIATPTEPLSSSMSTPNHGASTMDVEQPTSISSHMSNPKPEYSSNSDLLRSPSTRAGSSVRQEYASLHDALNHVNSDYSSVTKQNQSKPKSSRSRADAEKNSRSLFTTEPLPLRSTARSSKDSNVVHEPKSTGRKEETNNQNPPQSPYETPRSPSSHVSPEHGPITRNTPPKVPNWIDTNVVYPFPPGSTLSHPCIDEQTTQQDVSLSSVPNGKLIISTNLPAAEFSPSYSEIDDSSQHAYNSGPPSYSPTEPNPPESREILKGVYTKLSTENYPRSDLVDEPPRKRTRRLSVAGSSGTNAHPFHGDLQSYPFSIHDFTNTSQLSSFSYAQLPSRSPHSAFISPYRGSATLASQSTDSLDRNQVVPQSPSETGTPSSVNVGSEVPNNRLLESRSQSPTAEMHSLTQSNPSKADNLDLPNTEIEVEDNHDTVADELSYLNETKNSINGVNVLEGSSTDNHEVNIKDEQVTVSEVVEQGKAKGKKKARNRGMGRERRREGQSEKVRTESVDDSPKQTSEPQSKNIGKLSKAPSVLTLREPIAPTEDITKYLPMVDYDSYVAVALNTNDPGPFRKARSLLVNISRHNDTGKSSRTIKPFGADLPVFEDMEFAIPVYLRWETEPRDLEKGKSFSFSHHISDGPQNPGIHNVLEGVPDME